MKKFTTEEIGGLLNRVMVEEISFSRMVEIMNERVSDAEKPCVEDIPTYKRGDFLVKEYKDGVHYIFILNYIDDDGLMYCHCSHADKYNSTHIEDDFGIGRVGDAYHKCLRYATDSEKDLLIAELYKVGKRWNAEKKCVEDIPVRKFKKGDKVRIKSGISSRTHGNVSPGFMRGMNNLIGKTMTVGIYIPESSYIICNEHGWHFDEDWLEPYEELKEGDLAIFWDNDKGLAIITLYNKKDCGYHYDSSDINWRNAIKFESKEQFERLIKGEI